MQVFLHFRRANKISVKFLALKPHNYSPKSVIVTIIWCKGHVFILNDKKNANFRTFYD